MIERCGAVDTFSNEITIDAVATKDLLDFKISVFPNPTGNKINVSGIPNASIITLVDGFGKVWRRINNATKNVVELNLSELSQGVYFVRIENERGQLLLVEKIIKN